MRTWHAMHAGYAQPDAQQQRFTLLMLRMLPHTPQEKVRTVLDVLNKNRRAVVIGAALLDVAFIWVLIKLGKTYVFH